MQKQIIEIRLIPLNNSDGSKVNAFDPLVLKCNISILLSEVANHFLSEVDPRDEKNFQVKFLINSEPIPVQIPLSLSIGEILVLLSNENSSILVLLYSISTKAPSSIPPPPPQVAPLLKSEKVFEIPEDQNDSLNFSTQIFQNDSFTIPSLFNSFGFYPCDNLSTFGNSNAEERQNGLPAQSEEKKINLKVELENIMNGKK